MGEENYNSILILNNQPTTDPNLARTVVKAPEPVTSNGVGAEGMRWSITQFLPRDAMLSAVYAVVVCLSVCLLHSSIVSKRQT